MWEQLWMCPVPGKMQLVMKSSPWWPTFQGFSPYIDNTFEIMWLLNFLKSFWKDGSTFQVNVWSCPKPVFQSEAKCELRYWYENDFSAYANKTYFHKKSLHLASFWWWKFLERGNGLIYTKAKAKRRSFHERNHEWVWIVQHVLSVCYKRVERLKIVSGTSVDLHTRPTYSD